MYACTFFGHRDTPKEIEPILRSTLIDLIEHEKTTLFYVGNHGRFDSMVEQTLQTLKSRDYPIRYYIVSAYLPQEGQEECSNPNTLFPEGLELVPRRFAVPRRNRWMIDHADTVITYAPRPFGGAAQFKDIALKKGKTVIELANRIE